MSGASALRSWEWFAAALSCCRSPGARRVLRAKSKAPIRALRRGTPPLGQSRGTPEAVAGVCSRAKLREWGSSAEVKNAGRNPHPR